MTVAAIDFRSPEHSNRRLEGTQFLQASDVMFFDELLTAVRGLAPEEDRVEQFLPSANEMGAWDKAYSIYSALKRRPPKAEKWTAPNSAIDNKLWTDYLRNYAKLLELVGREISDTAYEFLGLEPGDLESPTGTGREYSQRFGGRHSKWIDRANRIAGALGAWTSMSDDDKRRLPLLVTVRRMNSAIIELEKRVAALEAQKLPKRRIA